MSASPPRLTTWCGATSRVQPAQSAKMMLVVAASILEDILVEFFENLFIARPNLIPTTEAASANVSAMEAAERATRGGSKKILRRVSRLTGYEDTAYVGEEIANLVELRNLIIHEGALPKISIEDVEEAFHSVHRFLKELGLASVAAGVPVRDRAFLLASETPQPRRPPLP